MIVRTLRRLHGEETGMALVISLMVAFVILMLSSVVVAQSIHSLNASGFDRQRLTSYNAAEAGANAWWEDLQTTPLASFDCTTKTAALATAPNQAQYSAAVTFYAADGSTAMACPLSTANPPSYVKVVSTGTSEGEAAREVETFAKLTPTRTGFGSAILSNADATFSNNFDVYGLTGNDGDVYILNGNLTMGNSTEIRGNVYVPTGSASISNSGHIFGNLWSSGAITMSNSARVDGDLKSNSGAANGSNSASVGGNAYSGTTIGSGLAVSGTKYPNYTLGAVPTQTFPSFTYNASDWAGYTITTLNTGTPCTAARTLLTSGTLTGNNVIRIAGSTPCTLTFSNNNTISVPGDLAVITDWGITMGNHTSWEGTSGSVKKLMLLSTSGACGSGNSSKNISESNNTEYNSYINLMLYTPCQVSLQNSNGFKGQVLGGSVDIQNQFTMYYTPVLVPGLGGTITGFTQDIAYVREI
jgi:Tfp pilus assembly protein PilX